MKYRNMIVAIVVLALVTTGAMAQQEIVLDGVNGPQTVDNGDWVEWSVTASIDKFVEISGDTQAVIDLGAADYTGWTWEGLEFGAVNEPVRPAGFTSDNVLADELLTTSIKTNTRILVSSQIGTPLGIETTSFDGTSVEFYYLPMDFGWFVEGWLDWYTEGSAGGQWGWQEHGTPEKASWLPWNSSNANRATPREDWVYWREWVGEEFGDNGTPLAVQTESWADYLLTLDAEYRYQEGPAFFIKEGQEAFKFNQVLRFHRDSVNDPAGDYTMNPEGLEGTAAYPFKTFLYTDEAQFDQFAHLLVD